MSARPCPQPLPIFPKTPEDILSSIRAVITEHEVLRESLVNTVTPETACFDNVIRPLAELDNATQGTISALHVLEDVNGDAAAVEAGQRWRSAEARWRARADLHALVAAVAERQEPVDPPESRLWLERELLAYELAGHSRLGADGIEAFKKGQEEIDGLLAEFGRKWQRNSAGVWFTREELVGVPDD